MTIFIGFYAAVLIALFVYGANGYLLCFLRRRHQTPTATAPERWPRVTVQLPVYNERDVVERAVLAIGKLRYPGELEIQVLDDSTDDTSVRAAAVIESLRKRGLTVTHRTRTARTGYKAGALAEALASCAVQPADDAIAIFDADFVPPEDFLLRTIPVLFSRPDIACVQGRWDHLNRHESALTQAQAIAIDAHFAVEQAARCGNGLLGAFNGSGGVWRRLAIEDAGGWSAETLTEDLDLSYRAQLGGWRIVYASHVPCPAELPTRMTDFKRQQKRWAQGSTQTALKIMGPLWRSALPLRAKLQGTVHLTHYAVHPLMLLSALLALPLALMAPPEATFWTLLPPIALATGGPAAMAVAARRDLRETWRLRDLAWLMLCGVGLAVSNSAGVVRGLRRRDDEFVRTPKGPSYVGPRDALGWIEVGAAFGCAAIALLLIALGIFSLVPFLLLYAGGLGWVGRATLRETRRPGSTLARGTRAASELR